MSEERVCGVCGRVLDFWTLDQEWKHSIASTDPTEFDHPPVPVTREQAGLQQRPRCDFCFEDDPTWVVPARSFSMFPGESVGDWAACEECARCISTNQWNRLRLRAQDGWARRHPERATAEVMSVVEGGISRMYRTLRRNITGAPRRIDS